MKTGEDDSYFDYLCAVSVWRNILTVGVTLSTDRNVHTQNAHVRHLLYLLMRVIIDFRIFIQSIVFFTLCDTTTITAGK